MSIRDRFTALHKAQFCVQQLFITKAFTLFDSLPSAARDPFPSSENKVVFCRLPAVLIISYCDIIINPLRYVFLYFF